VAGGISLEDRLAADVKDAMRSGDTQRREAIRMLRAALKNEQIERRRALTDVEEGTIVSRLVKRHQESIEQFQTGNRDDLVAHEEAQLAALQPYVPQMMPRDDVVKVVAEVMAEAGAEGPRAQGRIMAALSQRLRGKADMKLVSEIVREQLGVAQPGGR
jgi:uncharacterized protein YqeY